MTQSKSQVFDKVERFITKEMEKRHVPGFSVAIVQGKEIVWAKGFGYSNLEREIPASPETVYRVASVSKPVIATGLLQWMERGRFHLDDPVNDLMEEVKIQTPFKEQPTVRNLLSHTSGLPVHVDPLYFHINETVSLEDLIRESAIAVYPPNERIIYSNTAFNIIGYLVGLFAGEPYPHYMERGLFKPLEMNSSSFEQTPKIRRLMAQPYSCKKPGGPLEAVKPWYGGSIPEKPCGSLFSSALDLCHFLIAHMNGGLYKEKRILKEETLKEMHRLQASAGSSRSGYALAWKRTWHYGNLMLSHTGGNLGWTAHVAFYPVLKTGIVILCNLNDNSGWRPPAREALHLLVGGTLSFDPESIKREVVPDQWKKLEGTYTRDFRNVKILIEDGNLVLERGAEKAYLEELDKERYLVHGGASDGMELTFEFDEEGAPKQIDLETETFQRFFEDKPLIDEDAILTGVWHGNYVHPYGYFKMELRVDSETQASAMDMNGTFRTLSNFKAKNGRVVGVFRFKNIPGYVGWGASDMKAELDLVAIEGRLEGRMTIKSDISETTVPLKLSKKNAI